MSESSSVAVTERDAYEVVVNDEEQYSVWESGRQVPAGWHTVGVSGAREVCLEHIEQVWTDMRPKSLRVAMGEN